MTSSTIRQKYIDFFKTKGHKQIPSSSLIPENDPTVLFTTAGMHPLVPYLLGEPHPLGRRLCNAQKCIRTGDIDEVGDNTHFTFFEMLGNWSLGDYFKADAIKWSFEFLTSKKWLGLDIKRLAVSVFAGDADAPRDEESAKIWQSLGIPKERIAYLGKADNWWGPAGQTGPCGPDTEMFYRVSDDPAPREFDPNDKHWVEIWNDVFMEFNKTADGEYKPLSQKNVDTGMGLERITAVLQGVKSVHETDLFKQTIDQLKSKNSKLTDREIRIITDHVKAAVFIIADGIEPSNVDQGYVVRKLIRRAMRYQNDLIPTAREVVKIYQDIYPEVNNQNILTVIRQEQEKFGKTLKKGLKELSKLKKLVPGFNQGIDAKTAFNLYQSYGLPLEIIKDETSAKISENDFQQELKKHQELSRTASAGRFKAGLADNQEKTVRLHTATHLLLAALRQVLGEDIKQAGSNITPERLRFDFTHKEKMAPEQILEVEKIVNEKIQAGLPVSCMEMTLEQAEKQGALATFKARYPEKVKVYSIGGCNCPMGKCICQRGICSAEICSGPHAQNTSKLGQFKIIKEESSSSGIRRIKAVLK
ncbi:MAG: alanine--tRNA ligase [Patescibacteria group bacterium]